MENMTEPHQLVDPQFVQVIEMEGSEKVTELPIASVGTILLSTLQSQFPAATGLKYRSPSGKAWRGVQLMGDHLYAPHGGWAGTVYVITAKSSDIKEETKSKEDALEEMESNIAVASSSVEHGCGKPKCYLCSECDKCFNRPAKLKVHHLRRHAEKPYKCQMCSKSFARMDELKKHTFQHKAATSSSDEHGCGKRRCHLCSYCGKCFNRPAKLKVHVRTHTGDKPFECRTCFKTFARKDELKEHDHRHSGTKNYACPLCDWKFITMSDMKKHAQTHTDIKPYTCNTCGFRFRRQEHLTKHYRIHQNIKPYTCEVCSKLFRYSETLTVHMRTHTGEKPFECPMCHQMFASSSAKRKHTLKKHTKNMNGGPDDGESYNTILQQTEATASSLICIMNDDGTTSVS